MNTDTEQPKDYTKEQIAIRQHFLREQHPCPDVDDELSSFLADHAPRRIIKAWQAWAGAAVMAAACAIAFVLMTWNKPAEPSLPKGAIMAYEAKPTVQKVATLQRGNAEPRPVSSNRLTCAPTPATAHTQMSTLSTPEGTTAELTLPDGTKIWLNANSRLTYPDRFNGRTREVKLEGEAYFSVAHDSKKPFIVHAGGLTTKVLGTQFNVRAYPSATTHVTLVNGRVQVSDTRATKTLTPGEDAEFGQGHIRVTQTDTERFTAWRDGDFYFDDETLLTIATEIGKWYNVTVIFNSQRRANIRLFFSAPKNGGVKQAVDILNTLVGGKVRYRGGQIIID